MRQTAYVILYLLLAFASALETDPCSRETTPGSLRHNRFVNAFQGKHIVFVGDSTFRYQYLALAYYLTHGTCPTPGEKGFIISEYTYDGWADFFRRSSAVLQARFETHESTERCLCHRENLTPGEVDELRTFQYRDRRGRVVDLSYIQYFSELYRPFNTSFAIADSLLPTHVVAGWGAWFDDELKAGAQQYAPSDMSSTVCSRFQQDAAARGYELVWMNQAGRVLSNGSWVQHFDADSPLNVPAYCGLDDSAVLDRFGVLALMQRDGQEPIAKRLHDGLHFSANANHVLNTHLSYHVSGISRLSDGGASPRPMRWAWTSGRTYSWIWRRGGDDGS